jgi:hypothetical protein
MRKQLLIIFVFISSVCSAQQLIPYNDTLGFKNPIKWKRVDSSYSVAYMDPVSPLVDGYMTKEYIKKLDSLGVKITTANADISGNWAYLDNKTKSQDVAINTVKDTLNLLIALRNQVNILTADVSALKTQGSQNAVNIQQVGTQVDLNKQKILAIITELNNFIVKLKNLL